MQKEVHMRIDQSRQQSRVAEVDDSCALGMLDRSAHRANAIRFNEDFTGLEHGACVYLQQPRRVQHDRSGLLLLCQDNFDRRKQGQRENKNSTKAKKRTLLKERPHEYEYAALAPFLSMDK
jgi:hypothetical protein